MMDALNEAGIHTLVFMTCAQVGKTEIINNIIGYYIHQDPSPIILLQPTIQMAQAWSKDRLAPMVRDCPVLKDQVKDPRSRDANNTILHKSFPGGHITMAGANSAASLASRPVRIVCCDEVDRYPLSAGTEGDPVSLAVKRAATFWNRRVILTSTPTIRDASRIEQAFRESDQRRFFVTCPKCSDDTTMEWQDIEWLDGKPETAQWKCPGCGHQVPDAKKAHLLASGRWEATAESSGVAGFHINELCGAWRTWPEIVGDFLKAREVQKTGDFSMMQVWVNTSLGETWEEVGHTVEGQPLFDRREHYQGDFPTECNVLTIGGDCQDNRVEWEVVAWGPGEESWGVDYCVVHGDLSLEAFWDRVAGMMRRTYERADGVLLEPRVVMMDSGGHFTDEVYKFSLKNGARHFLPIKGSNQKGQPVVKMPHKANSKRVYLTTIGPDTAKEVIYQRYEIEDTGPGYCHWPIKPCYNLTYFEQATAEKKVRHIKRGVPHYEWHLPSGKSNEALDCRVYAFAGIRLLQQYFGVDLAREVAVSQKPKPAKQKPGPPSGGFVSGGGGSGWFER